MGLLSIALHSSVVPAPAVLMPPAVMLCGAGNRGHTRLGDARPFCLHLRERRVAKAGSDELEQLPRFGEAIDLRNPRAAVRTSAEQPNNSSARSSHCTAWNEERRQKAWKSGGGELAVSKPHPSKAARSQAGRGSLQFRPAKRVRRRSWYGCRCPESVVDLARRVNQRRCDANDVHDAR